MWLMVGCTPVDNIATSPTSLPTESANQEAFPTSTMLSSTPDACQFSDSDLSTWAASLPYEEAALFPQTYQEQSTLNLWFMNPSLTQANTEEVSIWAMESAFSALKQLTLQDDCVMEFDNFFVTVVDPQYRAWFSGSIRPADVEQLNLAELNNGNGEIGGGRITPTDENTSTGGGQTCRWGDIAGAFQKQFPSNNQSIAFTLIQNPEGLELTAYFVVPQTPTDEEVAHLAPVFYDVAGCWQPQIQGISIILMLPNYQLLLTGYQPVRPGGGFDLSELTYTRFDTP